jgi:hypothetical protein
MPSLSVLAIAFVLFGNFGHIGCSEMMGRQACSWVQEISRDIQNRAPHFLLDEFLAHAMKTEQVFPEYGLLDCSFCNDFAETPQLRAEFYLLENTEAQLAAFVPVGSMCYQAGLSHGVCNPLHGETLPQYFYRIHQVCEDKRPMLACHTC